MINLRRKVLSIMMAGYMLVPSMAINNDIIKGEIKNSVNDIKTNYNWYLDLFDYNKSSFSRENLTESMYVLSNKYDINLYEKYLDEFINGMPDNYLDYNLNFKNGYINSDFHYYLKNNKYHDYIEYYWVFRKNNINFKITLVLDSDTNIVERQVIEYQIVNTINTILSLPNYFIGEEVDLCFTNGKNYFYDFSDSAGAYYLRNSNAIVIYTGNYPISKEFYTKDVIVHELSHKYDYMFKDRYLFDKKLYSECDNDWKVLFEQYKDLIPDLRRGGYKTISTVSEFFAESMSAFFLNREGLMNSCPLVYNKICDMLNISLSKNK